MLPSQNTPLRIVLLMVKFLSVLSLRMVIMASGMRRLSMTPVLNCWTACIILIIKETSNLLRPLFNVLLTTLYKFIIARGANEPE